MRFSRWTRDSGANSGFVEVSGNLAEEGGEPAVCWCRGGEPAKELYVAYPRGSAGEAVACALKEWPALERYVDDWQLTPDNNAYERGIRPFVMGHKNRVMSGFPAGAKSSCELYTLIETAKANGWNTFKYLVRIFEKAAAMRPSGDWGQAGLVRV